MVLDLDRGPARGRLEPVDERALGGAEQQVAGEDGAGEVDRHALEAHRGAGAEQDVVEHAELGEGEEARSVVGVARRAGAQRDWGEREAFLDLGADREAVDGDGVVLARLAAGGHDHREPAEREERGVDRGDAGGRGQGAGVVLLGGDEQAQAFELDVDAVGDADRGALALVEEEGGDALALHGQRALAGDGDGGVEDVAAAFEADGAALGADRVDGGLDGERARVVRGGGDADGAGAAVAAELGRPELAAVLDLVGEGDDGEAGVVALDAVGRGLGELLDLGAGGAGGEAPVVHLAEAAGAGERSRRRR